jgi:hypothetical protein
LSCEELHGDLTQEQVGNFRVFFSRCISHLS